MKSSFLRALVVMFLPCLVHAVDTTPPTLSITHSWVEKVGNVIRFKMILDPRDDIGFEPFQAIEFRTKLNSTAAIPASVPWNEVRYPWVQGQPFDIGFNCTSLVVELRAVDAAGNRSALQRRTFASPFPFSPAPNLEPKFGGTVSLNGPGLDCRGLFAAPFDTEGYGDDVLQVDRASGVVSVRRQGGGGVFVTNSFTLTPGSINDSAVGDFNGDGRPDIAIVVDNTLKLYMNEGVVSGQLEFTETSALGLLTTGISTVQYVAVSDVTGEGKPDIVISGMGDDGQGGSVAKIGHLLNNGQFNLSASNHAVAAAGTVSGRIGLGDVSGDGHLDVVMVDPVNRNVVFFRNQGNGAFYGEDAATADLRPQVTFTDLAAKSLAVGDVTGDGRADAVITKHLFGSINPNDPNDTRNYEFWQLLDSRGTGPLRATGTYVVSEGPPTDTPVEFKSDVMLQDLTGDLFPELIFSSHFEPGANGQPDGGVAAFRVVPQLNAENLLTSFSISKASTSTGAAGPHRLTTGRFSGNAKRDILVANSGAPEIKWVFNTYNPLSKDTDLAGGVSTDSDEKGTASASGVLSYIEYVGGHINYSLNYVNNTSAPILGAVLECALPVDTSLKTADEGHVVSGTGAARVVRWTLDLPAGSSGVKNFKLRLDAGRAGTLLAPKITLKKGTVTLVSKTMPQVRIAANNFTVIPNSATQNWFFSYKPAAIPDYSIGAVQVSQNGIDWTGLPADFMTKSPGTVPEYTLTSNAIPPGSRFFRALMRTDDGSYQYSSVFTNVLPPTLLTKITTKSTATVPPKSGQAWTFVASNTSTAANVSVRFQSTETPFLENTWTDLPQYTPTVRAGSVWTSNTFNVPSGTRYFRAIAAAPGWVDSISGNIGPVTVTPSALSLPDFTFFHIDFVDPARSGKPATFYATTPSVGGSKVRFQSKLQSEDDSKWADLPDGVAVPTGTKWALKTSQMPVGLRNWRAISSAPGYLSNTSWVYDFEVLPPLLPQIPTYFGNFTAPVQGGVVKAGTLSVSLPVHDYNGVQSVQLQFATTTVPFKTIAGSNMTQTPNTITYTSNINFTGSGILFLRAVVVDGFDPSEVSYSPHVTVTVGQGNGSAAPTFVSLSRTFVQSTPKARGSATIKAKIGDDKQVYRSYLHRATAGGDYISTVGEMIRAGNTNPADFSCTDINLPDGTYYYRVVAEDFDGMERVSGAIGPVVIATPQPPPPPQPVNIDVAVSSRFVSPTVPTGKYNHASMPYPDVSNISFSFSGLPTTPTTFHVFRVKNADGSATGWDVNQTTWKLANTKASGTVKFPAPFWTVDTKNPYAGEGTYRIVVMQGGVQLPAGSGEREFTVGHAWNLPNTFTTLDYGLYWFKDGKNALLCRDSQDDEYFDRSKPTVIYVHGWQPNEVGLKRRESWTREDPYTKKTYDMVQYWKKQGYNVGLFSWNQFGNSPNADGLIYSQTNIYNGKVYQQIDLLPDGHSIIYGLYGGYDTKEKKGIVNYEYAMPGGINGHIAGKGVSDLLFDELERCMKYYPRDHDAGREFRIIGHSLGTQVVGEAMWKVLKDPGRGVPIPDRICLLELAQSNVGTILPPPNSHLTINQNQLANLQELIDNGVAIESYQSTDLASLLGAALSKVGDQHDLTAYARVRPDHIKPWDVPHSHNDIPRWYMHSFDYNEFPAYTYWSPFVKRDYVGKALSASSHIDWVYTLMGTQFWYEQSEGKNSFQVNDDQFELHDDRNQ